MRRGAAAVLALALAGCDQQTVPVEIRPEAARYLRDIRTGLCFAGFGRAAPNSISGAMGVAQSFALAAVPCTEAVMALVPVGQGGKGQR
jgi:hypothetical protein